MIKLTKAFSSDESKRSKVYRSLMIMMFIRLCSSYKRFQATRVQPRLLIVFDESLTSE